MTAPGSTSTIETFKTRRHGTGSCPKFLAYTFGTLKVAQAKNARMSRKIRRLGPPRQAGFKANGDCDLPGAIDQGLGALERTAHSLIWRQPASSNSDIGASTGVIQFLFHTDQPRRSRLGIVSEVRHRRRRSQYDSWSIKRFLLQRPYRRSVLHSLRRTESRNSHR